MTMLASAALTIAAATLAQGSPAAPPKRQSAGEIVAAAPAAAWRRVADRDVMVMELADGTRVVAMLAPDYAPVHVANIRALATARWWDGTSINRTQDNYVVQWGDATEKKPLPPGIVASPPAEYEWPAAELDFRRLPYRDTFAGQVGHADGWAVAREAGVAWLPHCYGMVGVGRNNAPDTGTGAELYTVIGHSPRQLDRNIALVGRIVSGMERLAARPRGTGEIGFYETAAERTPIVRVRLADALPAAERPLVEVMRTDAPSFAAWVQVRANRLDDFYIRPAGALDICNALPPTRVTTAAR